MKVWLLVVALTAPLPGGLQPTFVETFSHFAVSATGFAHGSAVWQTRFHDGTRTLSNNHEAEYYADAGPFSLQNGTLAITARPATGLPLGLSYSSGLLTTQQSFHQTYGYFAICAQLPRGVGFWPAFWLLPADGRWPPEIDVMEMLGDDPTHYYASVHADGVNEVTKLPAPDLTAGFHVYAVSWRPDEIRFYLDGVPVHDIVTPPDMHVPMYLLVNLAVGGPGSWPGAATGETGVYHIAWVRAWQFTDLK
jgi:beta-glucanase (GH16 family)